MNRCNQTIKEYHVAQKVKWKNVKIMWMKSRTNLSYLGLGRLRRKTSFNNNYIVDVLVIIIWKIHVQIKKQYLHRQVELCDHSSNLETEARRCEVAKFRSCGEGCKQMWEPKLQSCKVSGRVVARPSKMEILHREQFGKIWIKRKEKKRTKEKNRTKK